MVAMKGGGTEISSFSWDSTGRSQSRAYHAFGSLPSASIVIMVELKKNSKRKMFLKIIENHETHL